MQQVVKMCASGATKANFRIMELRLALLTQVRPAPAARAAQQVQGTAMYSAHTVVPTRTIVLLAMLHACLVLRALALMGPQVPHLHQRASVMLVSQGQ